MSVMKYPAGMLHDTQKGRFHPIVFRPAPFPGGVADEVHRYRSLGHHTAGFDTLDEAMAHINGNEKLFWSSRTWEWDGVTDPVMTEFFAAEELAGG